MALDEAVKLMAKIICPLLLILCPVGIYVLFDAPNSSANSVGIKTYVITTAILASAFIISLWYCRKHLGWFNFRKK